jgi:lysozyme
MSRDLLRRDLKQDEGTGPTKHGRLLPYWDCCGKTIRACTCPTQGKLTIGYGRNLEANGLSFREAEILLDNDIDTADRDLITRWPWVEALDIARHGALTQMCFNLGATKLAEFVNTLKAIARGDYAAGAVGMLASRWAEQVGARARRLASQMESGQWR